jgi:hypothetical protein
MDLLNTVMQCFSQQTYCAMMRQSFILGDQNGNS